MNSIMDSDNAFETDSTVSDPLHEAERLLAKFHFKNYIQNLYTMSTDGVEKLDTSHFSPHTMVKEIRL